jgi:hypothetical protein
MDKSIRAELAGLQQFYFQTQIEPCLVYKPQTSTQISATYRHEQHEPQVTFCVWTQISATFLTKHVNTVQFDSSNAYIGRNTNSKIHKLGVHISKMSIMWEI